MRDFKAIASGLKRAFDARPEIRWSVPGPDYLFAVVFGLAWTLFFLLHGAEITPDTALHMKYARNMRYAGDFFVDPIVPPLYPVLLHLLLYVTPTPGVAGTLLSGLGLLSGLPLFVALLRAGGCSPRWSLLVTACMVASYGVLRVYTFAWTEPVYASFMLAALLAAARAWEKSDPVPFAAAAPFASAAAMTRYVGYSLIAILLLYAFVFSVVHRRRGALARFLPVPALLAACIPSLLWVVRNRRHSGTPHGERVYESSPLAPYLRELQETLSADFGPVGLALLIAGAALFAARAVSEWRDSRRVSSPWILMLPVLALVYYALLLRSKSTIYISSPITSRYAFPAYFPLAAFTGIAFARGLPTSLYARLPVLAFFGAFLALHVGGLVRRMDEIKDRTGSEAAHVQPGFDRSATREEICEHLAAAFRDSDEVRVMSVYQWQKGKTDPRMADTLFYRGSVYRGIGARGVRFTRTDPHDFIADFEIDGQPKRLVYLDAGRVRSADELAPRLDRRARDGGRIPTRVFVSLKPGGDIIGALGSGFDGVKGPQRVTEIKGYRIYSLGGEAE